MQRYDHDKGITFRHGRNDWDGGIPVLALCDVTSNQ
jgi:hypothetical protein